MSDSTPSRTACLTVTEAACELRVCRRTVYNLIGRGQLRTARVGSRIRIRRIDLDAYLQRRLSQDRRTG